MVKKLLHQQNGDTVKFVSRADMFLSIHINQEKIAWAYQLPKISFSELTFRKL